MGGREEEQTALMVATQSCSIAPQFQLILANKLIHLLTKGSILLISDNKGYRISMKIKCWNQNQLKKTAIVFLVTQWVQRLCLDIP